MEYLCCFLVMICALYSSAYGNSCGPSGKCVCISDNKMDCSNTMLSLALICEEIGNYTSQNVSTLFVENNDIKVIDAADLHGCDGLSSMHLSGNQISKISRNSFTNMTNLFLLDISNNNLPLYDGDADKFPDFPISLTSIKFNGNVKGNITANESYPDLQNLNNLTSLYIDGFRHKSFSMSYRFNKRLKNLKMSGLDGYCNLDVVTNSTFENLIYLQELSLSSCNVLKIYAGAFRRLSELQVLDLSKNMQLGFRSFRNVSYGLQFTNIQTVDVSELYTTFGIGTQIQKKDICYLWNTTLRTLSVNSNRLMLFETNALALLPKTLNKVHMEDNKFTFAPYLYQVGCVSNLTELYANKQNKAHKPSLYFKQPEDLIPKYDSEEGDCPFMKEDFLKNITNSEEGCPYFEPDKPIDPRKQFPQLPKHLKVVYVADSTLQYNVTSIFVNPPNNELELIDASGNVLFSWAGAFGPFPKLKYLNLSRNYCSNMRPIATKYLGSVENAQFDQNFLGLVLSDENEGSHIFDRMINLRVLNLSSNIINYMVPTVFSKLSKLRTLDLSVNNIDTWTVKVDNMDSLGELNLRFNALRSLPEKLRVKLEENSKRNELRFEVDLRNNTIPCTCENKDFLEWMLKYRSNMKGFTDYIFQDNAGERISADDFVSMVKRLDKECRSYVLVIIFSSIGISLFLAVLIGGLIYRHRWKLRYLIRMSKMKYFGFETIANADENNEYQYDAFISYADENSEFVSDRLVPYLEDKSLKLCLHGRDFQPGRNVIDNILHAIRNSKKTVAIISEDFVKSPWCMYEFNMARMDSIYSRQGLNCLVAVMYEQIPARAMSNEMLHWIQLNTYLEYTVDIEGEQLFLQSLHDTIHE